MIRKESEDVLNMLLVKLFNDILKIEAAAIKQGEFSDLSVTENHIIEAIGRDGLITLGSYIKYNKIYIYVEDNGCGMDSDTLDKIKDMFYTTKRNGTGIGVSLSNEIVKAHNGELIYESTLGKGTKTLVVLPLQE